MCHGDYRGRQLDTSAPALTRQDSPSIAAIGHYPALPSPMPRVDTVLCGAFRAHAGELAGWPRLRTLRGDAARGRTRGIAMHCSPECMMSVRLVRCPVPTRSFWSADPHPSRLLAMSLAVLFSGRARPVGPLTVYGPVPSRNLPRAAPSMGAGACGPAKRVLDERRFTPPNIEARPSASGARRRSYTRGSEVGDRCRPSLKP